MVETRRGAKRMVLLFLATVITAVICHAILDLPPAFGMMMGLAYLQFFGYFLKKTLPYSLSRKRECYKNDPEKLAKLQHITAFNF